MSAGRRHHCAAPLQAIETSNPPATIPGDAPIHLSFLIGGRAVPDMIRSELAVTPRGEECYLVVIRNGEQPIHMALRRSETLGEIIDRLYPEIIRASYPSQPRTDESEVAPTGSGG